MKLNASEISPVLWFFLKPYKSALALLLGLMFISGMVETANLAVIYPIINYGLEIDNQSVIIRAFNALITVTGGHNYFLHACILLLIISFFSAGFKYAFSSFSYRLMVRIVGDTQRAVFNQYMQADYNFYVSHQQGKLIHTATVAPEHVFNMVLFAIRGANELINALTLLCMLIVLSAYGTLLLLIAGALYMVYIRRINEKIIYTASTLGNQADRRKNVVMNEFITGIKPIRVFRGSTFWQAKYNGCVEEKLVNSYRMLMGRVIPEMSTRFVFFLLVGTAGIVLSFRPNADLVAALPVLGTFVLVANRFIPSVNAVGSSLMSIIAAFPNAQIVYNLLSTTFDRSAGKGMVLKRFDECIRFDGVAFGYPSTDKRVLNDVSFAIEKKRVTAVVGPSGSGKSTIVNLLLKLYRPQQGQVLIDGVNIDDFNDQSYLEKVGYVSQETFIFNDTIRENIRFGMEGCSTAIVEEAARLAHAHDFIVDLKDGYDTLVGDMGVMLSGGQRQRIAIARGMLRKPEIMVLDEATSALDNISERNVQEAIATISTYTTVFVIAHRLSTVQHADCILVLSDGVIAEAGTHQTLMQRKGLYFDLYQSEDNDSSPVRN